MIECRKRVDLDAMPVPPEQPEDAPCLHYIAGWGGRLGLMAEAVLWGLNGNRELTIRNLRAPEVTPERLESVRGALERAARQFAHAVDLPSVGAAAGDEAGGALFGDVHERNRVAFEFAQLILGPDPMVGVRGTAGAD